MVVSAGLDTVLSRRATEHAERAAEARAERHRENTERAAVEHGEAVSQREERQDVEPVDPAAVFDKLRDQDMGRLLDIAV